MPHVRLALAAALSTAALIACAEVPAQEESLIDPPDAGALAPLPTKNRTPTDAGHVVLLDASPAPATCAGVPDVEPNDEESPGTLGAAVCGSLVTGDVDAFAARSLKKKATLRFVASGDAELELHGFGLTRTLKSGEDLVVPSFPIELGFTVVVSSPSGTPQPYRIAFE
ncbi:MAG: hypothetical protein U0270_12640 [Labilithrix sp.]